MHITKLPCLLLLRPTIHTSAFKIGLDTITRSRASNIHQRYNSSLLTTPNDTENMTSGEQQLFGRFKIASSQIFYRSKYSFAMVNLRPIVPGHVLVVSNRIVPLLSDLESEEHDDLWRTVRTIQSILKQQYNCNAFNVAVQDGAAAGQSVPHVHVHILPRYDGDLARNDDIYDELEDWAPRDAMAGNKPGKIEVLDDGDRRDRTVVEMAEEALIYKRLFESWS
ncbi:hypothetical protein ACHAXN_010789 [Cyclotella atomus]